MKNRMKKLGVAVAGVLLAAGLFGSGVKVGAATTEPGTMGDPLISQSYLDLKLSEVNTGFTCVTLAKGNSLELEQGAQLLLYTGNATSKGSLIDTSAGVLKNAGGTVERYHLYLATADGSGFMAASTCVVYVNGKVK